MVKNWCEINAITIYKHNFSKESLAKSISKGPGTANTFRKMLDLSEVTCNNVDL
jgi:hypothetical protein